MLGVDLVKDSDVLQKAYDDSLGVTAAFNLNVLKHLNRIIGSDFDVVDWEHFAVFNQEDSRIEMHLRAKRDVLVTWPSQSKHFKAGEMIHTENSYKYTKASFSDLLIKAGFCDVKAWTDPKDLFMVCYAKA